MITREKAISEHYEIKCHIDESKKILSLINKIYDEFEQREIFLSTKDVLCNDCEYYLSDNGNFPLEPCSECSRFYSDSFIRKANKEG